MRKLIAFILISLFVLYLIVSFISLTPNIIKWEASGRAAYLLFGAIFGIGGYMASEDFNKPNNRL